MPCPFCCTKVLAPVCLSHTTAATVQHLLFTHSRRKYCCHSLLFITAELPLNYLSHESLITQNCACLKGIKSAGAPCCPTWSRGQVWSCFGHFDSVIAMFRNRIHFPSLEPLNASRAHRVCKILLCPKIISRYLPSHTMCVPEIFAGNERSEVPENRGDPRGGF